jgi:hypothetical protein
VESPHDTDHVEWSALRLRDLAAAMPEASIAVLVQTNDQAVAMLDGLRRCGVEASGEGAGAVADDPAVAAVIAALVLADHPGDTIAAFHVAGSQLGAVVGLQSTEPGVVLPVSRRLREDLVERGAAPVVGEWRRALREQAGARGRMRLAQAVDLAERFDREGGGRPGDLATYLSRATVESPRHAGVRVMTIHRAKGLEFDVVVMPALDRVLLRPPHAPVYLLRRSPLAPVEAVHRSASAAVRRLAPDLEDGHRLEAARRLRDDLSVLYVALTRARLALHLWVEPAAQEESLSFAGILRATLSGVAGGAAQRGENSGETTLYRCGDMASVAASIEWARRATGPRRQGALELRRRAAAGRQVLRAATTLDELLPAGTTRGADLFAIDDADGDRRGDDWNAIERMIVTADQQAPLDAGLARAREWLLAQGRTLARLERGRRFAVTMGGRVIAGELARVWIATAARSPARALIGVRDRRRASIERRTAALALGLPDDAVAALVRLPELDLVTTEIGDRR